MAATLAVIIFIGAYVLFATEWVHRTKVALTGAGLMLLLRITDSDAAFFDETTGIEWNVIFLLLGMMIVVSVLRRTGVFEYIAIWCAKRSRGRPYRLMVMLTVLTAVASAFLDNVTTVLLFAPVTLLVCERLGLPPVPYLIAEVFASNIGGTATLVGDPPNIIIASRGDLSFNDFLVHMAPWSIVLMVIFCLLCRRMFRAAFVYDPERVEAVMALNEREAIKDRSLLVRSLVVLAGVVIALALQPVLHYEPSVVALLGAGILVLVTDVTTNEALADVEWPTLAFFAGLFIMVGSLVETGVVGQISEAMADATDGRLALATMLLLGGSAGLSAVIDNIPYVATMSPVVSDLVAGVGTDDGQVLWWALAFGAGLGGNATAIGASANVVVLGLAERAGHRIGFWEFTRYGLVVTLVTVVATAPYLWLRYL
ncbi:MAG TPA: ArsB/NhaD family transporter [Nocardioides sp.]|nr:ArsB/NhaD family transporter [Nocardioides sp.]